MKKVYSVDKENILYVILGIVGLFLFYSFSYVDILATTEHGMNVWTCLFDGNLSGFYQYNSEYGTVKTWVVNLENLGAGYDFPIYIFFALWNFPLWLLRKITSINVFQNIFCLMWMKSILLVFVIGVIWILQKIGELLGFAKEEKKLIATVFLSSAYFVSVIILIGEYDIIPIFFMLCGTYFYMKRNRRLFLLFFIIAVPLKMFAFFYFLALVLYDEKNLLKIFGMALLPFTLIILTRWFIPYADCSNDVIIPAVLLSNGRNISVATVPLFVFPMGITYLICYFKKRAENDSVFRKNIIYLGFIVYATIFVCCRTFPYWIIYILPFSSLLFVAQGAKYLRVNILLEAGSAVPYVLAQMFEYPSCYGNTLVGDMLVSVIVGAQKTEFTPRTMNDCLWILTNISSLLDGVNIKNILIGIFAVCTVCFAIINFPFFNIEKFGIIQSDDKEKTLMLLRIITGYALCILPIGMYLATLY